MMKAIVLAAGYATRLYPLTKNCAKPLLSIGDETILDFILKKIDPLEEIDGIYIVTNDKFYDQFTDFVAECQYDTSIEVLNDGTLSNEDRLGAIGDIQFVIDEAEIGDDLLIVAGDNLFGFDLNEMMKFYHGKESNVIALYLEENLSQLMRGGTASMDENQRVLAFEEKPNHPVYPYAVPTFYMIRKEDIHLFGQYLAERNNPDANGLFIPYLLEHSLVYGFEFNEYRYDIGTLENYQYVKELFE